MSVNLTDIESLQDLQKTIQENESVVVDFWAPWCSPCKTIAPVFAMEARSNLNVVFCKVNIEQAQAISQAFRIRAIPTFMYYKEGNKIDESTGADVNALKALVTKAAQTQAAAPPVPVDDDLLVVDEETPATP